MSDDLIERVVAEVITLFTDMAQSNRARVIPMLLVARPAFRLATLYRIPFFDAVSAVAAEASERV